MSAQTHRARVTILVLGDLGRSPRMLNHALAFAETGADVCLGGYRETPIDSAVRNHPRIRLYRLRTLPRAPQGVPRFWFLLVTLLRSICLLLESFWFLLIKTRRSDAVLVQNPPAVPTLFAGWLSARLRRCRFIIDWHNFGYTMLTPRLEPEHWVVRLAKRWERGLGRKADANLCVSRAMQRVLRADFGVADPVVLYDRPREILQTVPIRARSALAQIVLARAGLTLPNDAALVVCPTSWGADEDMELLFDGLQLWDSAASSLQLMVLITGRGPLREAFEQRLSASSWRRTCVRTAFLDPGDYRELLCAAHFGISLHRSSSGVDLPMKIMDLFGARTPVCALDYAACLTEQIQPGHTALTFRTSPELAQRIDELLVGFPGDPRVLDRMQQNIEAAYPENWQEVWQRAAGTILRL